MIRPNPGDRPFPDNPALIGLDLRQADATLLFRQAIGGEPIQQRFGPGPGHIKAGKARQAHNAHPFAHGAAFGPDQIKGVRPAELQLFSEIGR